MSVSLSKIKKLFLSKTSDASEENDSTIKPQIGFKIAFNEESNELKVRVIGARRLPVLYGNLIPEGNLIKVRVFPGRDKFETQLVKDSWPNYNEEFNFRIYTDPNKYDEQFTGKFVVLTAYAILNDNQKQTKSKSKNAVKNFFSFSKEGSEFRRSSSTRRSSSNRLSLSNRRTVGAVTYNLEPKFFTQKLRNGFYGTPDIWREVQEISSGLEVESRESKKGALEVTVMYSTSEDGNNDMFEVSLSRLRCSMSTMVEHEKLKGTLYIKMVAFEDDEVISKWKSDRFEPTISLKIEPQSAVLQAFVNNSSIQDVKILIKLMSKNILGKKTLLGEITLDQHLHLWREILRNPSTPITRMMNLA